MEPSRPRCPARAAEKSETCEIGWVEWHIEHIAETASDDDGHHAGVGVEREVAAPREARVEPAEELALAPDHLVEPRHGHTLGLVGGDVDEPGTDLVGGELTHPSTLR